MTQRPIMQQKYVNADGTLNTAGYLLLESMLAEIEALKGRVYALENP